MVFKDRAACKSNGFAAMLSAFESRPLNCGGRILYFGALLLSSGRCRRASSPHPSQNFRRRCASFSFEGARNLLPSAFGVNQLHRPGIPPSSVPRRCASPLRGDAASTTTAFRVNQVPLSTYSIFQSRVGASVAVATSSFRSRGAASTSVPRLESTTICRR